MHYILHKGKDGMTPYQRVKGKEWRMTLPAFGESVDYRKRTRHKLEARWARGVFLGVNVDSTEKIVGTADGVYIVQAIRRVPEREKGTIRTRFKAFRVYRGNRNPMGPTIRMLWNFHPLWG